MEENAERTAEMEQQLYGHPNILCIGHHNEYRQGSASDEELDHAQDLGYNMVTSRITNESYKQRIFKLLNDRRREDQYEYSSHSSQPNIALPPMDAADSNLSPGSYVARFIFTTSDWIDVTSMDSAFADISLKVLCQEISYAAWCGASTIMIQGPNLKECSKNNSLCFFAHAIREALSVGTNFSIMVNMPMMDNTTSDVSKDADRSTHQNSEHPSKPLEITDDVSPFGSWDAWNVIRGVCKYSPRVMLALTVPQSVPNLALQARWISEPTRLLHVPRTSFVKNDRGYEVLKKPSQDMLIKFMDSKSPPWILLSGIGPLPGYQLDEPCRDQSQIRYVTPDVNLNNVTSTSPGQQDPTPAEASHQKSVLPKRWPNTIHLEYLRTHLQAKVIRYTGEDRSAMAYQDFLQDPLQPLRDNLESMTYEVFERDPYKYEAYGNAITRALQDWLNEGKSRSGPENRVVLAVVGAGRGPLVDECLKAAVRANADVEVWAVEKNPPAFFHIQKRNITEWGGKVHPVHGDMRNWKGPTYPSSGQIGNDSSTPSTVATYHSSEGQASSMSIDILVSELIGSFGDNELSPECIDGVQRLLNPVDGISIPCEYTAHITPIATSRLHSDLLAKTYTQPDASKDPFQIPYVVWLHTADYLSCNGTRSDERGLDVPVPSVQQLWKFRHPNPSRIDREDDTHNARFAQQRFSCKNRGECHGLAGYFEAILYDPEISPPSGRKTQSLDVDGSNAHPHPLSGNPTDQQNDFLVTDPSQGRFGLSTHPTRKEMVSPKMISWFPILFPLRNPLYVPDKSELQTSVWRRTDGRKVWYEWLVESFAYLENAQRQHTRVRLGCSDLHSSENTPSLM